MATLHSTIVSSWLLTIFLFLGPQVGAEDTGACSSLAKEECVESALLQTHRHGSGTSVNKASKSQQHQHQQHQPEPLASADHAWPPTLLSDPASDQCRTLNVDQVILPVSDRPYPRRLGRCALVGASDILLGRKHGAEIDSYDTVVRINRVPTDDYSEDMGSRLDVLFKNMLGDYLDNRTKMTYMAKNRTIYGNCIHETKEGCPMKMMLYEAGGAAFREKHGWNGGTLRRMALPFVRQTDFVQFLEHNFDVVRPGRIPSAGLKSFVTLVGLCDEIRLYGFGGWGTPDHHIEGAGNHNLTHEHEFFERVARGESLANDFVMRHPDNITSSPVLRSFIESFQSRLECMGKAGRIDIVH